MSGTEMTSLPPQSNMADFSPLSTNPHPPHDVIHPTWPTFYPLSTNPDPRIKTRPPSLDQLALLLLCRAFRYNMQFISSSQMAESVFYLNKQLGSFLNVFFFYYGKSAF